MLAQNSEDWRKICSEPSGTGPFVRSIDDWSAARRFRIGLIDSLSEEALDEFEESLIFRSGGLGHAHYSKVEDELGAEKLEKFFEIFGIGSQYFREKKDRECASRGTCSKSPQDVCTDNC